MKPKESPPTTWDHVKSYIVLWAIFLTWPLIIVTSSWIITMTMIQPICYLGTPPNAEFIKLVEIKSPNSKGFRRPTVSRCTYSSGPKLSLSQAGGPFLGIIGDIVFSIKMPVTLIGGLVATYWLWIGRPEKARRRRRQEYAQSLANRWNDVP